MNKSQPRTKKTIGILQPGYLPWLGFFEQVHRSDVFILYDDVQFEKGSWRNRNRIKGPNGPQWLTVPVLTKGKGLPLIKDVEINASVPWQRKHMKAIAQNYSKAPFFKRYEEGLFNVIDRPWKNLRDLDLELTFWITGELGIKTPMILSSELGASGSSVQRLIDIIHSLDGNHFYEGSAGKNYIDASEFEKAGITVTFQDYSHPQYRQINGAFISHLSVIDLLFNCGPDSLDILAGKRQEGNL